jgi:hypothetical protein
MRRRMYYSGLEKVSSGREVAGLCETEAVRSAADRKVEVRICQAWKWYGGERLCPGITSTFRSAALLTASVSQRPATSLRSTRENGYTRSQSDERAGKDSRHQHLERLASVETGQAGQKARSRGGVLSSRRAHQDLDDPDATLPSTSQSLAP